MYLKVIVIAFIFLKIRGYVLSTYPVNFEKEVPLTDQKTRLGRADLLSTAEAIAHDSQLWDFWHFCVANQIFDCAYYFITMYVHIEKKYLIYILKLFQHYVFNNSIYIHAAGSLFVQFQLGSVLVLILKKTKLML